MNSNKQQETLRCAMQLEEAPPTKGKMGEKDPDTQLPEIPGRHRRAQIPVKLPNKTNPLA